MYGAKRSHFVFGRVTDNLAYSSVGNWFEISSSLSPSNADIGSKDSSFTFIFDKHRYFKFLRYLKGWSVFKFNVFQIPPDNCNHSKSVFFCKGAMSFNFEKSVKDKDFKKVFFDRSHKLCAFVFHSSDNTSTSWENWWLINLLLSVHAYRAFWD